MKSSPTERVRRLPGTSRRGGGGISPPGREVGLELAPAPRLRATAIRNSKRLSLRCIDGFGRGGTPILQFPSQFVQLSGGGGHGPCALGVQSNGDCGAVWLAKMQ